MHTFIDIRNLQAVIWLIWKFLMWKIQTVQIHWFVLTCEEEMDSLARISSLFSPSYKMTTETVWGSTREYKYMDHVSIVSPLTLLKKLYRLVVWVIESICQLGSMTFAFVDHITSSRHLFHVKINNYTCWRFYRHLWHHINSWYIDVSPPIRN